MSSYFGIYHILALMLAERFFLLIFKFNYPGKYWKFMILTILTSLQVFFVTVISCFFPSLLNPFTSLSSFFAPTWLLQLYFLFNLWLITLTRYHFLFYFSLFFLTFSLFSVVYTWAFVTTSFSPSWLTALLLFNTDTSYI